MTVRDLIDNKALAIDLIATAFDLDETVLASSPLLPRLLSELLGLHSPAAICNQLVARGGLRGALDPYAVIVARLQSLAGTVRSNSEDAVREAESASPEHAADIFLPGSGWVRRVR